MATNVDVAVVVSPKALSLNTNRCQTSHTHRWQHCPQSYCDGFST